MVLSTPESPINPPSRSKQTVIPYQPPFINYKTNRYFYKLILPREKTESDREREPSRWSRRRHWSPQSTLSYRDWRPTRTTAHGHVHFFPFVFVGVFHPLLCVCWESSCVFYVFWYYFLFVFFSLVFLLFLLCAVAYTTKVYTPGPGTLAMGD